MHRALHGHVHLRQRIRDGDRVPLRRQPLRLPTQEEGEIKRGAAGEHLQGRLAGHGLPAREERAALRPQELQPAHRLELERQALRLRPLPHHHQGQEEEQEHQSGHAALDGARDTARWQVRMPFRHLQFRHLALVDVNWPHSVQGLLDGPDHRHGGQRLKPPHLSPAPSQQAITGYLHALHQTRPIPSALLQRSGARGGRGGEGVGSAEDRSVIVL